MRNAIVVFTKVPKLGKIKTRLTTDRGGIMTPAEAMEFYEGCLLDVINVCIAANCGDVWICHNRNGDDGYLRNLLDKVSERSKVAGIFADQGGTFDECIQYAADYILKNCGPDRLADSVMIVGGDIPSLQPTTLQEGARKLERLANSEAGLAAANKAKTANAQLGAAIIEGCCQEGGFSIIGYTCTTPFAFQGIFYNMDGITALDMLVAKAKEQNIPFGTVEMAPDVDIPIDLASIIPVIKALQLSARYDDSILVPKHTINIIEKIGLESSAAPPQR